MKGRNFEKKERSLGDESVSSCVMSVPSSVPRRMLQRIFGGIKKDGGQTGVKFCPKEKSFVTTGEALMASTLVRLVPLRAWGIHQRQGQDQFGISLESKATTMAVVLTPTIDCEQVISPKDGLASGLFGMELEMKEMKGTHDEPPELSETQRKKPDAKAIEAYDAAIKQNAIAKYTLEGVLPAQGTITTITVDDAKTKIATLIETATTKKDIDDALKKMFIQLGSGKIISGEMFFRMTLEAEKNKLAVIKQGLQGKEAVLVEEMPATFATGIQKKGNSGDGTLHMRMEILAHKYLQLSGCTLDPIVKIAFNTFEADREFELWKKVWGKDRIMEKTALTKDDSKTEGYACPAGVDPQKFVIVENPKIDPHVLYGKTEGLSSKEGYFGQFSDLVQKLDPAFWDRNVEKVFNTQARRPS